MFTTLTKKQFEEYKEQGFNRIPLVLESFADLDTPLSVYTKLANQPYSYLLESVEGGDKFGRYSIIGLPSKLRIQINDNKILVFEGDTVKKEINDENPLDFIDQFMANFKVPTDLDLPRYSGGLAGYFGYETIKYIEPKLCKKFVEDKLALPDILLMLSDEIVVFDNISGTLFIINYVDPSITDAYELGLKKLQKLVNNLQSGPSPFASFENSESDHSNFTEVFSEFGEEHFKTAVDKAKQYIFDGDIMQVVLSQRMTKPFESNPLSLYRTLRSLNPSPYMFFYHMGDHYVVGASPEILVTLVGEKVTVRPIAGTRPRGQDDSEDIQFEKDLLADPKEIAEHVQLMDLGRNDVGRVAKTGTVNVTDSMIIEKYSHVMHIVSNVEGVIKDKLSAIDVLKASFPAGTVSGAPKVRAMEIINELEDTKRGVYSGAVGYLGFDGDMNVAIAIRTAVIKDNMLYVQAGAGIVADSVPKNEWVETQNKAKAILKASELVQSGQSE
jgi:anthranilate synthase component 1|tara:strand:+ start:692 stop:2188 length:1497 start_codon:yes stop_codon:yes gene_type:complete